MSQSDYIKNKKIAVQIKNKTDLGNVINSGLLTEIKTYVLPNTIVNTSFQLAKLNDTNIKNVFGMEKNTDTCPQFKLCVNTRSRENRSEKPLKMFTHYRQNSVQKKYFWDQKLKEKNCIAKEFKECDEYLYRRRIWFKK